MGKVWVTSDWHFGHTKDFLWGPRGFKDTYEMGETIIKNHNSVVGDEDDVYFLGDGMLEDNEYARKCIAQLRGKIHIVLGNHDSVARKTIYEGIHNVVEVCYAMLLKYGKYHFWLSHYPTLTSNMDADKPLTRRVIALCGHTHTQDRWLDWNKGLIYHCEQDAHNCFPKDIEEIINEIKEKIENEK